MEYIAHAYNFVYRNVYTLKTVSIFIRYLTRDSRGGDVYRFVSFTARKLSNSSLMRLAYTTYGRLHE